MYLAIHTDALGSLAGAFLVFLFTLYSLLYIRMRHTMILTLDFILIQLSLFIFLLGYALYTSSLEAENVLLWTRICYAGASLTPGACSLLDDSLKGRKHGLTSRVYAVFSLALTAIMFLPGSYIFTGSLNPEKSHHSVIKGPLFPYYIGLLILLSAFVLIKMIIFILRNRKRQPRLKPVVFGMAVFFLSASFDGIYSAVLSRGKPQLWVGPAALAFSLALYVSRSVHENHEELERLRKERAKIYHNLIHDNLTGVYTRDYLYETIHQVNSQINRNIHECSLLYLDVDNFKILNDERGHAAGDALLKALGNILLDKTRNYDIAARMGGDEFVVFLPDSSSAGAEKVARHIQKLFASRREGDFSDWSNRESLSLSIGIVSREYWTDSPKELVSRADRAMYQSKKSGKDRITHYRGDGT